MKLAIDFGASVIDAVLWDDNKIVKSKEFSKEISIDDIKEAFCYSGKIIVTGGCSAKLADGKEVIHVDEIKTIAYGGAQLAGVEKCIVVSCGTGTCITSFNKGKVKHLGGTGLGGGTIKGLSKINAGIDDINKIKTLSEKGDSRKLNLSVEDIVGCDIGKVAQEMTASNFGKTGPKHAKEDIIACIIRMVAENIIMLSMFAAQKEDIDKIVFTGRVSCFRLFEDIADEFNSMFPEIEFTFEKDRHNATAKGLKEIS